MFPPRLKEEIQEAITVDDLQEDEKEEAEEIIKELAENSGATENNIYYNKLKQKQQELIECIESEGAKDKHGKPCGFRRA